MLSTVCTTYWTFVTMLYTLPIPILLTGMRLMEPQIQSSSELLYSKYPGRRLYTSAIMDRQEQSAMERTTRLNRLPHDYQTQPMENILFSKKRRRKQRKSRPGRQSWTAVELTDCTDRVVNPESRSSTLTFQQSNPRIASQDPFLHRQNKLRIRSPMVRSNSVPIFNSKGTNGKTHIDGKRNAVNSSCTKAVNTSDSKTHRPDISVHRLFMRPPILTLHNGAINTRLRYFVQLHRSIIGFYMLTLELRISPDFPPIYVSKIKNLCAQWPFSEVKQRCAPWKPRFLQKGNVCFCHMPAGFYHQRIRLKTSNIFDRLDVPDYIVNILFNGGKLDLYLRIKLEKNDNEPAGCLNVKLPVLLSST